MEPKEFFDIVLKSLTKTKGDDPLGCDFFVLDMEELFNKWREESDSTFKKINFITGQLHP